MELVNVVYEMIDNQEESLIAVPTRAPNIVVLALYAIAVVASPLAYYECETGR